MMQTYKAGTSNDGFTLIEIVVTIFIVSIFLSFAIPNLPDITGYKLKSTSRKLRSVIMFVRNQAITKKKYYRLTYNLEKNSYIVDEIQNDKVSELESVFRTKGILPVPIEFDSVEVSNRTLNINSEIETLFTPQGYIENTSIYLKDNSNRKMTILVHSFTGKVTIHEGHVEARSY